MTVQAKELIRKGMFYLVAQIDEDYISSAKTNDEVVLLYVKQVSKNQIEYIVKAGSQKLIDHTVNYIMRRG